MSLIRLLSVGQSLGTIRDAPSRFKMAQQNLLPRFGPAKPLASPTDLSADKPGGTFEAQALASEQKTGARMRTEQTRAPTPTSAPGFDWTADNPVRSIASDDKMKTDLLEQRPKAAETPAGFFRYFTSPWKGWALLRNIFGTPICNRLTPFQAQPGKPFRKHGPVQAELGLDMVKPLRNDLTDSDLEMIPARKPLAGNESSATLIGRTVPSARRQPQRGDMFIATQGLDPASPSGAAFPPQERALPESASVQKSDFVGACWGRLRSGLFRFRSRQT